MSSLSNLGYVVLGVSDLAAWERFAVDLIGLQVGRREGDHLLTLRMDELAQRIVLERSDADDLLCTGWQLDSEADLLDFVASVRSHGVAVEECSPERAHQRRVRRLFRCADPNGFHHEFFHGPSLAPAAEPFRSSVLQGPGFRTGDLGMGHVVPRSIDYPASLAWYSQVLGLIVSDVIREQIDTDRVGEATFFHTRTGRHHSLATTYAPVEKVLAHLMVEMQELDDVGLSYDRCVRAGKVPYRGIGRHTNDRMLSFYVRTPSGFAIEVGHGGLVIDDANWNVTVHTRRSDWGHQAPPAMV